MDGLVSTIQSWLPFVAFFLPLVVGLTYKSGASNGVKAVLMLVFTGVAALVNQVDANAGILTVQMLQTWLATTIVTIASYYGVWKPIGAGNPAPDVGVG